MKQWKRICWMNVGKQLVMSLSNEHQASSIFKIIVIFLSIRFEACISHFALFTSWISWIVITTEISSVTTLCERSYILQTVPDKISLHINLSIVVMNTEYQAMLGASNHYSLFCFISWVNWFFFNLNSRKRLFTFANKVFALLWAKTREILYVPTSNQVKSQTPSIAQVNDSKTVLQKQEEKKNKQESFVWG